MPALSVKIELYFKIFLRQQMGWQAQRTASQDCGYSQVLFARFVGAYLHRTFCNAWIVLDYCLRRPTSHTDRRPTSPGVA